VSSGIYYARIKVNGKLIRQSLKTNVFTTAKTKLLDFLKEQRAARQRIMVQSTVWKNDSAPSLERSREYSSEFAANLAAKSHTRTRAGKGRGKSIGMSLNSGLTCNSHDEKSHCLLSATTNPAR
jgi:hypothetical protein